MGKQWVKQVVRHDEMQTALSNSIRWTSANRQTAGLTVGGVAAVLLFGGLFLYSRTARENAAWDKLSVTQALAYSGNPEGSATQAAQLAVELPGTEAAGYASLFAGDVMFQRGKFTETVAHYAKILEKGKPASLLPMAQGNTALAYEAAGQYKEAAAAAETYLQNYPDHYLAPQVQSCLARSQEALGQKEQAAATMKKIQLQYPDTSWSAWAQAHLNPPK